jgi:hypothetical protein
VIINVKNIKHFSMMVKEINAVVGLVKRLWRLEIE